MSDTTADTPFTPDAAPNADTGTPPPRDDLVLTASRHFMAWLDEVGASLAFSTYQAGKLFLIGTAPDGRLSTFERTMERCMALHATTGADGAADALYVSSLWQVWKFADVLRGQAHPSYAGYDRLYAPRRSWVTGDLDIHGLAEDSAGRMVFANTAFSCVAALSDDASFVPLWQPPFISRLAPEDRCHLNGLCLGPDGDLGYVTAVGRSDVADGWRSHRADGGLLIDVAANTVLCDTLSMPHSPKRMGDRVWLGNAGTGEFGFVDVGPGATGAFEPACFVPGFLRGAAFCGPGDRYAVVTTSLPRENRTFTGLPLDARLQNAGAAPRCGLWVIDTHTGTTPHWLHLEGIVAELFDVAVLPGVRRPAAIGFRGDEVRRVVDVGTA